MATKTVKHTVLARFNDNITPERINELIDAYSKLSKSTTTSFSWGTSLEPPELNRGYTHVFESTFESLEGLKEYLDSLALAEFNKEFLPCLSQYLVMDYVLH